MNFRPAAVLEGSAMKTLVVEFDSSNYSTGNGTGVVDQVCIPAGAYVVRTTLQVDTAWTGGTDLQVGTTRQDGTTAIDLDGFHTAAQLVTANLTAGAVLAGGGADIGTVVDASNDAYIKVTPNGTYTTGSARLIVDYIPKFDY
jgi:hypothetical protein